MGSLVSPLVWLTFSIGVLFLTEGEAAPCSQPSNLLKAELDNGKVLWWCNAAGDVFNNGNRVHESSCPAPDQIETSVVCTSEIDTSNCTEAVTAPDGSVELNPSSSTLPDFVKYFTCPDGLAFLSGSPGRFKQCLQGKWTNAVDMCDEECKVPRDCADIAEMGFYVEDYFYVVPTGNPNDDPILVNCQLDPNVPDWHGWMRIVHRNPNSPYPASHTDPAVAYILDIEHLAALTWDGDVERPLVLTFIIDTANGLYTATYGNVVIARNSSKTLLDVGTYHGNAGNAFVNNVDQDFDTTETNYWWNINVNDGTLGARQTSNTFYWDTLPVAITKISIFARPKIYDARFVCPPIIEYDTTWNTTVVDWVDWRSEGANITYDCPDFMYMEGPKDAAKEDKTKSGILKCEKNGGNFNWSKVPEWPCTITCPPTYNRSGDDTSCIRFSNEPAEFGITTASLQCSRDNASLAALNKPEDLQHANDSTFYYTAYSSDYAMTQLLRPTETDIPCASGEDCTTDDERQCLTVAKDPSSAGTTVAGVQKTQSCQANDTYYACMMPAFCPIGFEVHHGLCYKLIRDYSNGDMNNFSWALSGCRLFGSVLAYPESLDVLDFIWSLVNIQDYVRTEPKNILVGLNNIDDDWSSGGIYEPDDDIIAKAGASPNNIEVYRYLTVPPSSLPPNDSFLTPTAYEVNSSIDIHYAVCQLHGQEGCLEDPPNATENMYLEWNGTRNLLSEAKYRCYDGYFLNETIGYKEKTLTCRGQLGSARLGGWWSEDLSEANCTIMDVCLSDSVPCSDTPEADIEASPGFLQLNGTMLYTCPDAMAFNDSIITEMNVTCEENYPDLYEFTPLIVPDCNVCYLDPNVGNATSAWFSGALYTIGEELIFTCDQNYKARVNYVETDTFTAQCTENGWDNVPNCYPTCVDPPPPAGENISIPENIKTIIRSRNIYTCDEGTFVTAALPELENSVTITCGDNGSWTSPYNDLPLLCVKLCIRDPSEPPEPGLTSWDNTTRFVGTEINLTCPENHVFPDLNTTITILCEDDGHWTNVSSSDMVCRMLTWELPQAPNGSEFSGYPAPYWEGEEVSYICPDDLRSKSGSNVTSFTFNGTEWIPLDAEFACLNVCGTPPTPEDHVTFNFTGAGVEGDEAFYECLGGFEGNKINITSTCMDAEWSPATIPICKMCPDDPPSPPNHVNMTSDGVAKWGAVVSYTCSGKFPDGTSVFSVTCDTGNWTSKKIPACSVTETTPGPSTLPPIVLETDPPYDVSYLATAECHYPNILNNMTDVEGNPADYETPTGPFGFRSALRLQSSSQECVKTIEKCPSDAMDLLTGFSIGLWAKVIISADKFGEDVTLTDDDKQYILSTGGDDDCHTGIALYMKGDMLGGVVSVDGKVYAVEVNGAIPNNTWTNIGLRFEPGPQTLDSSGIVNDKTGGLELLVDMVTMAHVVFPQDCTDNGELDPSELMIGCHRTKGNSEYRNFINGEFDELAIWPRKLYNNETLYFAGGYKYHLEHIKGEEFLKQLDRVDLADVNQLLASVSISVSLATAPKSESTAPSATPTTGSSSSTGTASSQATASSPTSTAAASTVTTITEEEKENYVAMEILEKLTDTTTTPKVITPAQCIKMMDIAELASNLLQEDQAGTCKNIPMDTKPLGVMVADDLEYWLDKVFRSVTFDNGSEPLNILKSSPNILIQGSKRLIENWQENTKFYQIKKNLNNCNGHADQAAASTYMFSDPRCGERILSLTFTYYKTLQMCFPPVVNEALLYARGGYRIESRVVAIRADVDTKLNEFGLLDPTSPTCDPEDELLKEHPNRFRLCHNTQSKPRAKRSLQFHSDNPLPEVNERFCAWWNPDIRDYGAWDTSDCKVLETNEHYTKCACAHFGRFTIIAEKTELREVPDEEIWLTVTKYVGYIASFIALLIYIIIILVSGDLKDMFHLIGLNLAFSVFFGSIFMLVSDMDSIRDDRHTCTAIGTIIHIFYLGAGAWMFVLGHSSFKAITSGVISGRMRPYFFLAWSVPLLSVGLTYLLFMQDLGLDPRCFISWENRAKYVFFGPQLFFCVVAFVFGTIVLCNLSTPALRKDNLIEEYGSFCQGASFVLMFFSVTWIFGLFAYVRFYFKEPDFYPIFQVFNSWTGFIIFMFIGLASKRFRMVIAGQAKLRRQNLFGNAFGTPPVPVDDEEYLGSPADQRSKSSSLPSSGRTSPASPSDINVNRPASSDGPFTRSQVAGRPGSRPNSAF